MFGAPTAVSEEREAHLRFAMFLAMQRLIAHRDANGGVLPQSLSDVGEDWPGVSYHVIGDSVFELRAIGDAAQVLTLRSDRDARAFVDLSPSALRRNLPGNGGSR